MSSKWSKPVDLELPWIVGTIPVFPGCPYLKREKGFGFEGQK